ncbi:hypothetical protein KKP04_05850, partial [Rhodomicrobium sp. Az07]|nr:hypothetical protein [Rhodomicrobium sp. Az07]
KVVQPVAAEKPAAEPAKEAVKADEAKKPAPVEAAKAEGEKKAKPAEQASKPDEKAKPAGAEKAKEAAKPEPEKKAKAADTEKKLKGKAAAKEEEKAKSKKSKGEDASKGPAKVSVEQPKRGLFASERKAAAKCRGSVVWVDKNGLNHYPGTRQYGRKPGGFSCETGL